MGLAHGSMLEHLPSMHEVLDCILTVVRRKRTQISKRGGAFHVYHQNPNASQIPVIELRIPQQKNVVLNCLPFLIKTCRRLMQMTGRRWWAGEIHEWQQPLSSLNIQGVLASVSRRASPLTFEMEKRFQRFLKVLSLKPSQKCAVGKHAVDWLQNVCAVRSAPPLTSLAHCLSQLLRHMLSPYVRHGV